VDPVAYAGGVEATALLQLQVALEDVQRAILEAMPDPDTCGDGRYSVLSWGRGTEDVVNASNFTVQSGNDTVLQNTGNVMEDEMCRQAYEANKLEKTRLPWSELFSSSTICVELQNREESSDCTGDIGAAMLINRQERPVVVAIAASGENCFGKNTPNFFSKITIQTMQWIRSLTGGKSLATTISLEISALRVPPGGSLVVYRGSSQSTQGVVMAFRGGEEIDCREDKVRIEDEGAGALFIALSAGGQPEGEASLKSSEFSFTATYSSRATECLKTYSGHCRLPDCELEIEPETIVRYLRLGLAAMGGLSGEIAVDFDRWVCLRDWGAEEQRRCGIKPGQWACFYHHRRTQEYLYQGNSEEMDFAIPSQS